MTIRARRERPLLLVIGGVHLDAVADYDPTHSALLEKPATFVEFSVGGTAFNVAANLARAGIDVTLFTWLNDASPFGSVIMNAINSYRIRSEIVLDSELQQGGYLAQLSGGVLESAISYSGLDRAKVPRSRLLAAISSAKAVAIDTNLRVQHIRYIRNVCRRLNRPLLVNCASETKSQRIRAPLESVFYELVTMNEPEAVAFFGTEHEAKLDARAICAAASAHNVVITRSGLGFNIYSDSINRHFRAPRLSKVVSDLGAGDALFSGCCAHFMAHGSFEWEKCYSDIKKFVVPVLKARGATVARGMAESGSLRRGK
jgi:sugar/nucleoside kinase (ribokinase family)